MTDHDPSTAPQAPQPRQRRGRRVALIAAIVVAAGLTGAVATQAFSDQGFGRGGMHGFGMMGPGMMGFRGPLDAATVENRADRLVRHLAVEIDATAEQQEKLRGIVKSAVKDILPLRDKARATHEKAHTLLSQPKLDRAAIESFRAEQMALVDTFTKRVAQALGDAAEVLTPEQRKVISDHIERRRGSWRGWHRG
jgi:Spy/CpxP family protein refolding chaperone